MKLAFAVLALQFLPLSYAPAECVQVYYDAVPGAATPYTYGRVHAQHLQNLLGHFPDLSQIVIPIERYEKGQLDRCRASFYLGTYFDNAVPAAFLEDFASARRRVLWAGYNLWKLRPETLERLWEVRYAGLSKLDEAKRDESGRPTFFRFYDYRGQTFEKYGDFDRKDPGRFNAAFEIVLLEPASEKARANVVSWARHNGDPERRVPYVVARGGRWFVGDSPFSFIHESDRYLIFADLLFDVLGEPPRRKPTAKKPALFRIEDVSATTPMWQLYGLVDLLERERVPFSVAMIPIWTDALDVTKSRRRFALADGEPGFKDFLSYAASRRASFIFHGVTHQYGRRRNPFSGVSGDDFEFWDRAGNRPIRGDEPERIEARLSLGLEILRGAGIRPVAWMCPHYQASGSDYRLFARRFKWNVGRVIYFPGPSGQFYPYEIFGDVYGQRLVPENVGNVQPFMNEQVLHSVTIDDMIAIVRRNSVLRDAWASFFVHPSMLEPAAKGGVASVPGDTAPLERLIAAAKQSGYEFVDLASWTSHAGAALRPEPVEVRP